MLEQKYLYFKISSKHNTYFKAFILSLHNKTIQRDKYKFK